ncbi:hypothetical protein [Streptomyces lunaelactis]|uniref:hypothetical protein n=1 Tax=Streptomyces lunaelactis TaxID=1535768 RepID=UPI001584EA21|nr:hypothetical protein [Streptomyces lunaelactis]NUK01995.1 hypothetical protein [Streptomyces lunaelactis]NUK18457.1 hypothetical protein [Streptomyces lunaelactis]
MSPQPHLPLEGHPRADRPQVAARQRAGTALGEPKGIAEGVPTAVRPDPQQGDGRYVVAMLRISAPRDTVPTATSTCLCGWNRSAVGKARVLALIEAHTGHREACPLRDFQEGRNAA